MPKMGASRRPEGDFPRAAPPTHTQIGTEWIGTRDGARRRGEGRVRQETQAVSCGGALGTRERRQEAAETQRPNRGWPKCDGHPRTLTRWA